MMYLMTNLFLQLQMLSLLTQKLHIYFIIQRIHIVQSISFWKSSLKFIRHSYVPAVIKGTSIATLFRAQIHPRLPRYREPFAQQFARCLLSNQRNIPRFGPVYHGQFHYMRNVCRWIDTFEFIINVQLNCKLRSYSISRCAENILFHIAVWSTINGVSKIESFATICVKHP